MKAGVPVARYAIKPLDSLKSMRCVIVAIASCEQALPLVLALISRILMSRYYPEI